MGSSALIGKRSRGTADPSDVLSAANEALATLAEHQPNPVEDLLSLKHRYAAMCRTYYSVAALSRRRVLDDALRQEALLKLFRIRSTLENAIISDMASCGLRDDFVDAWSSRSFFGVSAKQGVSVRYALASCVPTRSCGGRCYAHDGRDRQLHHIFRGALNLFVGQSYERLGSGERVQLFERLKPVIAYGVAAARQEQAAARESGFERAPRIRFSHIGEMAATPAFTNELARQIQSVDPDVACVIYTRHPYARHLDSASLVINFTLEGDDDKRRSWAPAGSRVVASAWDGKLSAIAEVNFLEHHVEKIQEPVGTGFICPVTVEHGSKSSCDEAFCESCFVPPSMRG